MADRLKVLLVCSRNQWRSSTAEAIYRDDARVSIRSRGKSSAAVRTIRENDLAWEDLVLVMEPKQRRRLLADFPDLAKFRTIQILDISDDYGYLNAELVQLISIAADSIIDDFQTQAHNQS